MQLKKIYICQSETPLDLKLKFENFKALPSIRVWENFIRFVELSDFLKLLNSEVFRQCALWSKCS